MFRHPRTGYLTVARRRLQKIEKTVADIERKAKGMSSQRQSKRLLAELRRRRAQFRDVTIDLLDHVKSAEARVRKLSAAGAKSWSAFQTAAQKSRKSFSRARKRSLKTLKRALK